MAGSAPTGMFSATASIPHAGWLQVNGSTEFQAATTPSAGHPSHRSGAEGKSGRLWAVVGWPPASGWPGSAGWNRLPTGLQSRYQRCSRDRIFFSRALLTRHRQEIAIITPFIRRPTFFVILLLMGAVLFQAACEPVGAQEANPPVAAAAKNAGQLDVTFIDVGQGLSILIQAPDGKTALIDGGNPGSGALAYLKSQKINRIDVMIATHPHMDHIGGLTEVLGAMPIGEVWTPGSSNTTRAFEKFIDAIAKAKVPYKEKPSQAMLSPWET